MDYDKVNNPFITLRNHKTDKEFTVDLSKDVPNVSNDPNMSNLKKSNHALYSDNRADKLRWGDDVKTFGNYSITLVDIDNIIYEYFTNVINPTVIDTNNSKISVPVRHASPERWSAIQSDGRYRDDKGQLQRPIIVFTRTGVAKDDSFVTFNKYLSVPVVKKFSSKNSYDKISLLNSAEPLHEIHNITFPDHVVLTYDFTINTEYVEQMNQLIETINFADNDYWGDPARFKFRANIDSFSNSVEVPSDDDRSVSSTFTLTINAYLLPLVFNNQTNIKRGLSTRKVMWGTEAQYVSTDELGKPTKHTQTELSLDFKKKANTTEKSVVLNRKSPKVYLTKDQGDIFVVRIWKDLLDYTINIEGRNFRINIDESDHKIIWDVGLSEIEITPNNQYNIELDTGSGVQVITKNALELLLIKFPNTDQPNPTPVQPTPVPDQTPTPVSEQPTPTPEQTPTPTPEQTPTPTLEQPTPTPEQTPTPTLEQPTPTPEQTPTPTPDQTIPTETPTPTCGPHRHDETPTPREKKTPTPTNTPTPTLTDTPTNTPTDTPTPTNTPTDTPTPTLTDTPTNTPTDTPTPTETQTPTSTDTSTNTPTDTPTNTPTDTPTPTETQTPTSTDTPTDTPTNTPTDTPTPTETQTPTSTDTPTNTPTDTPTNTPTDTPTPVPIYELVASPYTINEGEEVTITLRTTNVASGTLVSYAITHPDDFANLTPIGEFEVSETGETTLKITPQEDYQIEGTEILTLTLIDSSINGEQWRNTSVSVTIVDSSTPPTYTLESSALEVDEGDSVTITLKTTNVPIGTEVTYVLTNIEDLGVEKPL